MKLLFFATLLMANILHAGTAAGQQTNDGEPLLVKRCTDFAITGKGDNPAWEATAWQLLKKLDPQGEAYESKFKILYSPTGIYVLFSGADQKISTTYDQDFADLFRGDVFEVFFHPAPQVPMYFEYEINQLNKELVLLIPNINGKFFGWTPWHYEQNRVVKKAVYVAGGPAKINASIGSWSAELFFPNALLEHLSNAPPVSGAVWNANFYRLDYDSGTMVKWAWSPVERNFHEPDKFRPIQFE